MTKKEGDNIVIDVDGEFVKKRLQGFFEKVNVRNALI